MTAVEFIEPLSREDGVSRATKLFVDMYATAPEGVWAAPGRVNLIGEHTDYNAGLCLPIALPHRTFIALKPREDTKVRVVSDVRPTRLPRRPRRPQSPWRGRLVRLPDRRGLGPSRGRFLAGQGFDAAFVSCVPLGSGLSSSAAMTCSTALALDDVYGLGYGSSDAGRVTLINAAIKSENDMAGASTGGLDQNARCVAPKATRCCLTASGAHSAGERLPAGLRPRQVRSGAAGGRHPGTAPAQRRPVRPASRHLRGGRPHSRVANLRVAADGISKADDQFQALKETLDALPDVTMKKRVRHVVTEIERVRSFVRAFAQGDIEAAGRLFNASHDSLAADYEVTVPELDVAVDVARKNGAYGARMTGGGFGGSIIALVDKGRSQEVAQKIADEFEARGFHAPRALPAVAAPSASREADYRSERSQ